MKTVGAIFVNAIVFFILVVSTQFYIRMIGESINAAESMILGAVYLNAMVTFNLLAALTRGDVVLQPLDSDKAAGSRFLRRTNRGR